MDNSINEKSSLEKNQYVVDITSPTSIANVLKHHIANFDSYLQTMRTLSKKGLDGVAYGVVNAEGEFKPLHQLYDADFDEELFFKAAVSFPELLPLLEEYASLVVKASAEETSSGPWTTEETILGEFLIPALAMKDKKYISLLGRFMKASVEAKFSAGYQQKFGQLMEAATKKFGGGDKFQAFLDKYLCTNETIDYRANDEFRKIRPKGLSPKDKTVICQRIQHHMENNEPVERLMINTYKLLGCMSSSMPLKSLQAVFSQIEQGSLPDLASLPTEPFEEWEARSDGTPTFYRFSLHFNQKEDVKKMLELMVNRFDELVLFWKYVACSDLRFENLDDKDDSCGSDLNFFIKVLSYPELEPLTCEYVKKHTESNKTFPLVAGVRGLGNYAAAALAVFNSGNDEQILQYLQSLPPHCDFDYLWELWKQLKVVPSLPKTFDAFPNLKK